MEQSGKVPRVDNFGNPLEIQWERFGKTWLGYKGDEVVCDIGRFEGAPYEAYGIRFYVDTFTSLETAKSKAEEIYKRKESRENQSNFARNLIPILEVMLKALKGENTEGMIKE